MRRLVQFASSIYDKNESAIVFRMKGQQLAESAATLIRRCLLCGERFEHRGPGRDEAPICGACGDMGDSGFETHRHPELMRRLAEQGVTLHRLPGGYFRILPRRH
jgi:hypothetical protein